MTQAARCLSCSIRLISEAFLGWRLTACSLRKDQSWTDPSTHTILGCFPVEPFHVWGHCDSIYSKWSRKLVKLRKRFSLSILAAELQIMPPEAVGRACPIAQRGIEVSKGPQGLATREAIAGVAIGPKEPIGPIGAIDSIGSVGPIGAGVWPIGSIGPPKIGAKGAVRAIVTIAQACVEGTASGSLTCTAILGLVRDAAMWKWR